MPAPARFGLDAGRLASRLRFGMLWAAAMVVGLDAWLYLGAARPRTALARWFDATSEIGLASWLAVTQVGLLALTAWAAAALARATGASRPRVVGWTVLACFFSYLALDDGTRLHEAVGAAVQDAGVAGDGAWFPSYGWQLALGPVFVGLGAFMVAFLWRELRAPRQRWAVVGAAGLMGTAVALDFVDGLAPLHPWNLYTRLVLGLDLTPAARAAFGMGGLEAVVHVSRAVEEALEIAAITLVWAAVVQHLPALAPSVTVRWASTADLPRESGDGASTRLSDAPVLAVEGRAVGDRPVEAAG